MSNEQRYYDALKRIAKDYQTPDQLRRNCQKQYGLRFEECIEMVYENLQFEAASAIKGKRRPPSAVEKDEPK
jgi:hypothetical protein